MTYLLVILILWSDPAMGPIEHRYEVRVVGHYNTRDRCERRRIDWMNSKGAVPAGRILWTECRAAD